MVGHHSWFGEEASFGFGFPFVLLGLAHSIHVPSVLLHLARFKPPPAPFFRNHGVLVVPWSSKVVWMPLSPMDFFARGLQTSWSQGHPRATGGFRGIVRPLPRVWLHDAPHPFLVGLVHYYKIQLHHLNPNGVQVSTHGDLHGIVRGVPWDGPSYSPLEPFLLGQAASCKVGVGCTGGDDAYWLHDYPLVRGMVKFVKDDRRCSTRGYTT